MLDPRKSVGEFVNEILDDNPHLKGLTPHDQALIKKVFLERAIADETHRCAAVWEARDDILDDVAAEDRRKRLRLVT